MATLTTGFPVPQIDPGSLNRRQAVLMVEQRQSFDKAASVWNWLSNGKIDPGVQGSDFEWRASDGGLLMWLPRPPESGFLRGV